MKSILSRTSISDFVNRNKTISLLINLFFDLFFFSLRKVNKRFANSNGNVLILSLNRLGDTLFTIPAIKGIQRHFNSKKITIACFPESIPLYKLAFESITFCELKHQDFYFNERIAKFKARKKLKSLRPQIIIDLIGSMASATLIYNLRAEKIIGMNRSQFKTIYDHYVKFRESPQLVDIYFDAISPVVKIIDRNELKKIPKSFNPKGKIIIHPFASWKEKEWGLKKFIELANKLNQSYSVSLLSPTGKVGFDFLDEMRIKGIDVVQANSVEELICTIKECSLFIGNDSGPVNIANFLGRPTFTIYGATNPDYTVTSQAHQIYIQKKLICSARDNEKFCIVGGAQFVCPGVQCMDFLSVDEVYNCLKPLTNEYCAKKF